MAALSFSSDYLSLPCGYGSLGFGRLPILTGKLVAAPLRISLAVTALPGGKLATVSSMVFQSSMA